VGTKATWKAAEFLDWMKAIMTSGNHRPQSILIVEDIEETRYLIEKLLKKNGYDVDLARDEEDAICRARSRSPDLILLSLGFEREELVATAQRIRNRAALSQDIAVVIFCVPTIPEGAEMEVNENVYVTRPDNFDQLRYFLRRLLRLHDMFPKLSTD
jgi:two-component system, NtrC family, nitrogen regulation response regulator GlnG